MIGLWCWGAGEVRIHVWVHLWCQPYDIQHTVLIVLSIVGTVLRAHVLHVQVYRCTGIHVLQNDVRGRGSTNGKRQDMWPHILVTVLLK